MKDILLIEDEASDQKLAIQRLAGKYQVDCAGTFAEVERQLGIKHYDAILLDLKIPGIDSRDILQKVKTLANGAAIIVLSGFVDPEQIHTLIQQNACQVLIKSVHDTPPDALPSAINTGIIVNTLCRKLEEMAAMI